MIDPEVKALLQLVHPNIVKLKEVIKQSSCMFMIFELLDEDLSKLLKDHAQAKNKINESEIRSIMYQITRAVYYMHKHGLFHRDLKPENILVGKDGLIKISDFGLVREIKSLPPYTDYVSTRWYRAPECVLRANNYSYQTDIFALGCIMAELYMLIPIFPGSSELDQLTKICNVLGTPTPS